MIKVTKWSPDTCGCELLMQWDDELPEDNRVHTPVDQYTNPQGETHVSKKCAHHANAINHIEHHAIVADENTTKNKVLGKLKDIHPDKEFPWSFDSSRKLQVDISKLQTKDKIAAKGQLGILSSKVDLN